MKYKAFTLAEVVIAAIFLGIIAALTIPTSYDSLKYKEHIKAYKEALGKIEDVCNNFNESNPEPPDGIPVASREIFARRIWQMLDQSVPTIGYADPCPDSQPSCGVVTSPSKDKIDITSNDLKLYGKWCATDTSTQCNIIPNSSGANDANTIYKANSYSPWIVLENGMAFTFVTIKSDEQKKGIENPVPNNCFTHTDFYHLKDFMDNTQTLYRSAISASCATIIVDVNGLDRGPNTIANFNAITESDVYSEVVNNDRFRIFITKKQKGTAANGDQIYEAHPSSGPAGLVESFIKRDRQS